MNGRIAGLIALLFVAGTGSAQDLAQVDDEDARFNAATQAVRDRDFRSAVALFEPLAEADVADAQYNLAVLLREGRGRPQNHVEALYWGALALLADETHAESMVSALIDQLPRSAREAVVARLLDRLMAQAADGQIDAPRKLARVYMELVPEPDVRMAYMWFSICHALGENRCAQGRSDTAGQIEPEELIEIQREAGETFAALPFSTLPKPNTGSDDGQSSELR